MTRRTKRRLGGAALAAGLLALTPARAAPANTVAGPSFEVDVALSQAAAARLANPKETIVVDAEIYGVPTSQKLLAETEGRLDLAPERKIEIPGAGAARFAATKLDAGKLAEVEGHAARVAIEVFSGRRSSPNNVLDCDFFDDLLSVAAEKPVQAHCKLIGEP
ncbi:MAG: hypothetical protein ABSC22_10010 [Roseiarcus sp.]|jgi:hypothetical protein